MKTNTTSNDDTQASLSLLSLFLVEQRFMHLNSSLGWLLIEVVLLPPCDEVEDRINTVYSFEENQSVSVTQQ